MKKLLTLLGLSLSLSFGAAYAADAVTPAVPAAPATKIAQQEKMKACNKDAGDKKLKGADRKTFMKACLSNKG